MCESAEAIVGMHTHHFICVDSAVLGTEKIQLLLLETFWNVFNISVGSWLNP
jgi:hypothetical protein